MRAMSAVLVAVVVAMVSVFRSRASLHLEVLALRHQLAVLLNGGRRPRLKLGDRLLWVWLSRVWSGWLDALVFVKPRTVISWQRRRFRDHWTRLSRRGRPGRPPIAQEVPMLEEQVLHVRRKRPDPTLIPQQFDLVELFWLLPPRVDDSTELRVLHENGVRVVEGIGG